MLAIYIFNFSEIWQHMLGDRRWRWRRI